MKSMYKLALVLFGITLILCFLVYLDHSSGFQSNGKVILNNEEEYKSFKKDLSNSQIRIIKYLEINGEFPKIIDFTVLYPYEVSFPYGEKQELGAGKWILPGAFGGLLLANLIYISFDYMARRATREVECHK